MEHCTVLVDTCILIDYFRKINKEKSILIKLLDKNSIAVSTITEFEFLAGTKNTHFNFVKDLFSKIIVLPFDSLCANIASEIYKDLFKQNKLIEPIDILIASTSIAYNFQLVTFNHKHFNRIKNLVLYSIDEINKQ